MQWAASPVQDENLDWETPEGGPSSFSSICRAEPSGKGDTIRGVDGTEIYFAFVVYMPLTETVLKTEADVTLTLAAGDVYTGKLKRQSNGQFNTRLWV